MPEPGNVHIDAALTNLAIRFRNLALVADLVFPVVPVVKESDKYYKFAREELRDIETLVEVGAESNEFEWDVTSETYSAEQYKLRKLVPDRIVRNSDKAIRPRATTVDKLMKVLKTQAERRVQAIAQSRVFVTAGATPSIKWDGTSPTIEANVDTAKQSIEDNAGVMGNAIVMNTQVKDVVKRDSTVRNLIRYTVQGKELLVNGELPPVLWNLKVIIAGAVRNAAQEGQANSISKIWVDNVLVFYVEPNVSIDALTLGYTLRVKINRSLDAIVRTWRVDAREGEMIEPQFIQAEKLVASECGYLITNVLT